MLSAQTSTLRDVLFPGESKAMYEICSETNVVPLRKISLIKEVDLLAVSEYISKIRKLQPNRNPKSADVPLVWERKSCGYRIVGLQLDRFMQALRFVLTHFCQTEPLSKAAGLYDDYIAIKSFMNTIVQKMSDMMSFCALREGTGELVGVLVASTLMPHQRSVTSKLHIETRTSKTQRIDALQQIMMLKNYAMVKALFYKALGAEKSMHIDVLCVQSDHQQQGIGTALLRSCVALATASATPCVGEFTSSGAQTIAKRLEFKILAEVPYKILGAVEQYKAFEACYPENYSITCMALDVTPPERPPPPTPVPTTPRKLTGGRSTSNKKRLKNK